MKVKDFRDGMVNLTCCLCGSWFWGPLVIVDGEFDLCGDVCLAKWTAGHPERKKAERMLKRNLRLVAHG